MSFPQATAFSDNSGANVTSMAIAHGGSVGDLVIFGFTNDGTSGVSTGGTGWTTIFGAAESITQGASVRGTLRAKVLDGVGDSISMGIAASQGAAYAGVRVAAGTFHSSTNPEQANFPDTSSTPDPPLLNPVNWGAEDTLWLAILCWDGNISLTSYPSDHGLDQSDSRWASSDGVGAATASREFNNPSHTPGPWVLSGGSSHVAFTVAVRPAPANIPTFSVRWV